jgi:hypothetical protein
MMSANMFKPGMSEHGLAGRIERDFKKFKELYGRCSAKHWMPASPSIS